MGTALWAAQRLTQHDSSYAFPRYCDGKTCNANSASAALNKWLKQTIGDSYVMHGLRHSLRDRLRAVECPSDIIDQIGGWTTSPGRTTTVRGTVCGTASGKGRSLWTLNSTRQRHLVHVECLWRPAERQTNMRGCDTNRSLFRHEFGRTLLIGNDFLALRLDAGPPCCNLISHLHD